MNNTCEDIVAVASFPFILIIVIIIFFMAPDALSTEKADNTVSESKPIMTLASEESGGIRIYKDDNGVMYMFEIITSSTNQGSCMMVMPDGSPRVWTEEEPDSIIECVENQSKYLIFKDTKTEVLYFSSGGNITAMKNPDGSIKVYQ